MRNAGRITGDSPKWFLVPTDVSRPQPPYTLSYEAGYRFSVATGRPMVVWVGVPPVDIDRAITIATDSLEGYTAPCIVAAKWIDGKLIGKEVKDVQAIYRYLETYSPVDRRAAPRLRTAAPAGGC